MVWPVCRIYSFPCLRSSGESHGDRHDGFRNCKSFYLSETMLGKEALRHLMEDSFCTVMTAVNSLSLPPPPNQKHEDIQLRDVAAINCQGKTQRALADTRPRRINRLLKQRGDCQRQNCYTCPVAHCMPLDL
jgi:hypothetical protein